MRIDRLVEQSGLIFQTHNFTLDLTFTVHMIFNDFILAVPRTKTPDISIINKKYQTLTRNKYFKCFGVD